MYNDRIFSIGNPKKLRELERNLRILILQWQLENVEKMLEQHEIDLQVSFPFLKKINRMLYFLTREDQYKTPRFQGKWLRRNMRYLQLKNLSFKEKRQQQIQLEESNRRGTASISEKNHAKGMYIK